MGNGKNNGSGDSGSGGRRVGSKRRTSPDLRKLSRAFIALAQAQAEAEAQSQATRERRAQADVADSLEADQSDRKAS
jgi:hypothetical protein